MNIDDATVTLDCPIAARSGGISLSVDPPMAKHGCLQNQQDFAILIVGATHLRDFLKPIGATAYHIAVVPSGQAQAQIEAMRLRREGSLLLNPDKPDDCGRQLDKAHEWFSTPVSPGMLGDAELPANIRIEENRLVFALPMHCTYGQIHCGLEALLEGRCLRNYLACPAGRSRLMTAEYPVGAWFHTETTQINGRHLHQPLEKVYLLRPRRELLQFVTALSAMIENMANG